eukprot:364479-Chlamydomonas_euryale.AAC.6
MAWQDINQLPYRISVTKLKDETEYEGEIQGMQHREKCPREHVQWLQENHLAAASCGAACEMALCMHACMHACMQMHAYACIHASMHAYGG